MLKEPFRVVLIVDKKKQKKHVINLNDTKTKATKNKIRST